MRSETRQLLDEDLEQAWELDRTAFHGDAAMRDLWLRYASPERMHGAFDAGRLVAMTATLPLGQFFGGRSVAMGGLSSVAVEPEYRGAGLATQVVQAAVAAMTERGEVISALYPGTTALYRGLGWELAGAYVGHEIDPRELLRLPRPETGTVRRAVAAELHDVQRCYEGVAPQINGFLARDGSRWWRLADRWEEHFVYTVPGPDGELEGYVVYVQEAPRPGEMQYGIRVIELIAETRRAAEALWWMVGTTSSQVVRVVYTCSPEDPLRLLLPEQAGRVYAELRWMLRINDAAGAIAQRGFPAGLDVEVELLLAETTGPLEGADAATGEAFVLSVCNGEGRLERGGSGEIAIGRGAFASLYSGWSTPASLARVGLSTGGDAAARARLEAAFAGPTPYLLEEF